MILAVCASAVISACSGQTTTAGPSVPKTSGGSSGSGATSGANAGQAGKSIGVREVDAYRFDVKSAEVLDGSKALLPPDPGKSIVGIDLAVTNTSQQSQPVSTFAQLALKMPGGASAAEVPPADDVKAFKDGSLAPGASVEGYVLYEVPNDALSKLVLEQIGDLSGSKATVDISLAPR